MNSVEFACENVRINGLHYQDATMDFALIAVLRSGSRGLIV